MSHPQAYFDADQVLASSPELDPGVLLGALPRADGLRVSAVEGLGLVAARRVGAFTHVVAGLDGTYPIELAGWRETPGELDGLDPRPVDLAFLADTPPGVATRLLDAALAGPVVFCEPDPERRAAWIAWLSYALPDGAGLTFSTAGDEGVHVRAADGPDALDTTQPCAADPSFYARVALELAARGELPAAAARLDEPDGVALAVHGGATDLVTPEHLPRALELITELATAGHVREAARAAAALPPVTAEPNTALVVREALLPEAVAPEPEPIPDADVVEDEAVYEVGISLDAFAASLHAAPEPPPAQDQVIEEQEVGMSLAELEASLKRERSE